MTEETKILIQSVLDGNKDSVKIDYTPPNEVIKYLEKCGFELKYDWDTNGWSVDFWLYFYKGEEEFMFSGSWYYGDYIFGIDPDKGK